VGDLRLATLETAIGRLWLSASPAGLREIRRGEDPGSLDGELDPEALAEPLDQVQAYLAGSRRTFDLELDLRGISPFDAAVWEAARTIPYGTTASYGDVAGMAGSPRAARAVGGAMARCSLAPVVPCHRVIRADGSLGGWGAEPWVKRWLLNLEGVAPLPRAARSLGERNGHEVEHLGS
jgi:O-6-methylguanine DNA methyltransferase